MSAALRVVLEHRGGIALAEHRAVEKPAVVVTREFDGGGRFWARVGRLVVRVRIGDANLAAAAAGAERLHRPSVRQERVVHRLRRDTEVANARRHDAHAVAHHREHPGLVQRDPTRNTVAVALVEQVRIGGEVLRRVAVRPAAAVLEALGKVPMVERERWLDPLFEQFIDQPVVEGEALFAYGALAVGKDAGPAHREAVGLQAKMRHQRDIVLVAVVVVTSDVARVPVLHAPRLMAEGIPDAHAAVVFANCAFNLVAGGCGAPFEPGRKLQKSHAGDCSATPRIATRARPDGLPTPKADGCAPPVERRAGNRAAPNSGHTAQAAGISSHDRQVFAQFVVADVTAVALPFDAFVRDEAFERVVAEGLAQEIALFGGFDRLYEAAGQHL